MGFLDTLFNIADTLAGEIASQASQTPQGRARLEKMTGNRYARQALGNVEEEEEVGYQYMDEDKLEKLARGGDVGARYEFERRGGVIENEENEDVGVENNTVVWQIEKGSFIDKRDGQEYQTVKMPDGKVWMAQNLNYKVDGSWAFKNNEANAAKYGRLYTWEAAKAACPKGWHLPTREEWAALVEAAGGKENAGAILKAKDGFSALMVGHIGRDGIFRGAGHNSFWWTATEYSDGEAYSWHVDYNYEHVYVYVFGGKYYMGDGFSARCVQNDGVAFNKTNASTAKEATKEREKIVAETSVKMPDSRVGSFIDKRDGQEYQTVKMPDGKIWMAQNLNYKVNGSWAYDNNEANAAKYGRLYTWEAAKAACPKGWHLPTREEWAALVEAAGGEENAGARLKAAVGWKSDGGGTDGYGFSALPGGYRYADGRFVDAGYFGYWWTATEYSSGNAYYRIVLYNNDGVNEYYGDKDGRRSVRCVQD